MPAYEVVWDGTRERGPYLNVAPDPPPRPAGPVLRQPWELTAADRAQIIADVHATTYRETANKWRLTVRAVQVIVGVQTKRCRRPTYDDVQMSKSTTKPVASEGLRRRSRRS